MLGATPARLGKFGARGIKGHEAVARRLDALAGFITTPVTARRGLLARLHYLTRTDHARAAAREAARPASASRWSTSAPNGASTHTSPPSASPPEQTTHKIRH